MRGGMDLYGIGIPLGEPLDRGFPLMRGTIIGNPEDSPRRAIRLLSHDHIHELAVGFYSRGLLADSEELGLVHIPRGKIGQYTLSFVFKLHTPRLERQRPNTDELPVSGLNTGLFVSADHVFVGPQRVPFEQTEIEVQDTGSPFCEEWVPWEKPTPMHPRLYRVGAQAAPDRGDADGHYNAPNHRLSGNVGGTEARKGEAQPDREFTGERFDFHHALRGKKSAVVRTSVGLPDHPSLHSRSVSATW